MASIRTSASSPKLNTRINQELKAKVLQEALLPNSSILKIAKHYNLSPKSIYNWRNHYQRSTKSNTTNSSNPTHNVPTKPSVSTMSTQDNFVELITESSISKSSPLNKTQDPNPPPSSPSGSSVLLSFNGLIPSKNKKRPTRSVGAVEQWPDEFLINSAK